MTFRAAALTHCRFQQKIARVIPGVKPVAATLVAAVLFLGISAAARADDPGASNDCAGLRPISLTASPERVVRGLVSSPTANCYFTLEVRQGEPAKAEDAATDSLPCVVTSKPVMAHSRGIRLETTAAGHCAGLQVSVEIVPRRSNYDVALGGGTSGSESATAKLNGLDLPGLTMFEHWAWLHWTYEDGAVVVLTEEDGYDDNTFWDLVSQARGSRVRSDTGYYDRWHSAVWHSDGFPVKASPDIGAETKATISGGPTGGFHCYFTHYWTYGAIEYVGKRFSTSCTAP